MIGKVVTERKAGEIEHRLLFLIAQEDGKPFPDSVFYKQNFFLFHPI
jgi:hypothetical protein